MVRHEVTLEDKENWVRFAQFLNGYDIKGSIANNDPKFFNFCDIIGVFPENIKKIVKQVSIASNLAGQMGYNIIAKGKMYYLTEDGKNICYNLPNARFPRIYDKQAALIKKQNDAAFAIDYAQAKAEHDKQEALKQQTGIDHTWTKAEVVKLLTTEAHIVGRMLGSGYDRLEPIHGEWIQNWLLNPKNFTVVIHQAHRSSYKSTCLRLAISILMILDPTLTIIVLRKSEDAVKECVQGVSKILDTPLFQTFISILYPDIDKKGGFKKTTDTALVIDTNLNTSLSGETQLRALGLGSPLTGKHAKLIITDDIVTTDDRESAAKRAETIMKYQELINILQNDKNFTDSRILNIGTPWHEEDAFKTMEKGLLPKAEKQTELENIPTKDRTNNDNRAIRLLNMKRGLFVYNCYQTGLMDEESIALKRQMINDDVLFAANYLLSLVSDDEKPFPKIDNVGHYSLSYFQDDCWECLAHIDAAYQGDDRTAVTFGGMNWDSNEVVACGKTYHTPLDQNYMEIAEMLYNNNVTDIYMETNTDKGLMGEKFREMGFNVYGYAEHSNKHTKIVSTIRPYWRENGAALMPSVQFVKETDEDYLKEVYDYKKGVKHDDAPDSLACFLLKGKFGSLGVRVT